MSAHACVLKTERLSALENVWKDLFDSIRTLSPFMSYEWFYVLARHLLKSDPEILVFRKKGGTVVGIIAATVVRERVELVGDERVTDLNGLLCVPGYEKEVTETFAEFVRQRDLGLDLFPLEADSMLVAGLKDQMPEVSVEKKDLCPLLDLPRTWDDYLGNLDGKSRHELRRKMRKINGTVIQDVKSVGIEDLFRLMTVSDSNKERFLTPGILAFFKDLTETFGRKDWLRMRALAADKQTVGMILAFALRERIYLYNMGFDPEYRSISPGIMTIALDIQSAINEGYDYYDFLRGDEDYKYRLGAKERYTMRIKR